MKRTPTTDALDTLGTIFKSDEKRDAIHLGVEPVVAARRLNAGDHVGFLENGQVCFTATKHVGIVDPFLTQDVLRGEKFWLVVYPRQITSLRHVWTHPDFPETADLRTTAREVLQGYADQLRVSYDELMEAARRYVMDGDYWSRQEFEGEWIGADFWAARAEVLGAVDARDQGNFLTCSC